jgi:hypothetical protein
MQVIFPLASLQHLSVLSAFWFEKFRFVLRKRMQSDEKMDLNVGQMVNEKVIEEMAAECCALELKNV